MKRPSIPMSFEEYEIVEHPFGWKTEYWGGQAHFTPREMGVDTTLDLSAFDLSQRQANAQPYVLLPVEESFTEQMINGYFEAFHDSVEFCNWPVKLILESAERGIYRYFEGKKGEPLTASVIALEPNTRRLAGLALFVLKPEKKPYLDLLYVRSPFRKQGIATTMLRWGTNDLIESDYQSLSSAYHVCNHQSRQWHHKQGFQDIYCPFYTNIKVGWLRNEIWRREKLEMLAELEELKREKEQWEKRQAFDNIRRERELAAILKPVQPLAKNH